MDQISNYREIRVLVYPGSSVARVNCLARVVAGGRRMDRALLAGPGIEIPLPGVETLADLLRAAAAALEGVADSL